ncbi:uncharacterized protein MEPE_02867 [Melanopsichium pennsylvanicum]|uniref:Peroxisomal membrane protein PEX14 n=2 Tax=Melanopsichium pennsylvanicum TaxID=63383 RepID=A0AAJ4XK06_9BASI|nr:putative protein [Melanopsichium pennsylvanicum 4]SNX84159.1 uncharacterized protein MEPE_02867 [Melanopsichium pennsylvanicum]
MADDNSNGGGVDASFSIAPASQQGNDRSQILAQATRFLTSANISESASDDDKREFLRSKGLTEEEIARAFDDSKSPASNLHARSHQPASGDVDPFELAAKQFDDPIHADSIAPPPKSYPSSPLALYYDPSAPRPAQQLNQQQTGSQQGSSLTRYQVLLQFFRTLSYLMMLSGGLTAILVGSYRAYILPKITAMFDARSIVLKHHIVLFDKLRSNVASIATYVPIQQSQLGSSEDTTAFTAKSPLKGVLKKVHFTDDPSVVGTESEKEGVKSTENTTEGKTEKVVLPGTDVVVDTKTPFLSEKDGSESEGSVEGGEEVEKAAAPKMEPIDLTAPIRERMARLAEALKGELCGSHATTEAVASKATTNFIAPPRARVASVADAGSGSDEWESESDPGTASDDDGLEFDPYGAYQKKHKHTQSSTTFTSSSSSYTVSPVLSSLKSALVGLNADISTHAFSANSSSSYTGGTFRFGAGTTDTGSGTESPKSGDLAQVKAEIRSLKGLLLSRRNFPSYGARPPPLPAATSEARTSSAVV